MFQGFLVGLSLNLLLTVPFHLSNLIFGVVTTFLVILMSAFIIDTILSLMREKESKSRKVRLTFFGITIASLLLALIDVLQFVLGFHGIKIGGDFPYLWLGDIPFFSILASFLLGSIFSVAERFLELKRKERFVN
jgi:hypothetical protein